MEHTALDYGNPDGAEEMDASYENNPIIDPREAQLQDASMDAEMQQWEETFQGTEEEYEDQRRKKLEELLATRPSSTKFYALPPDQAIEAGAKRGVNALPALDEEELMGVEGKCETDEIFVIFRWLIYFFENREYPRSRHARYDRQRSRYPI